MATASASFVIRACKFSILRFYTSMSRFSSRSNSALILVRRFATSEHTSLLSLLLAVVLSPSLIISASLSMVIFSCAVLLA
jgi:hypothetical protein